MKKRRCIYPFRLHSITTRYAILVPALLSTGVLVVALILYNVVAAGEFSRPGIREPVVTLTAGGTVDVTVEVESASETRNGKTSVSGVYDLRLFRDGQLVGSAIPAASLEGYIAAAPAAVARDIKANRVLKTEEDQLWQNANDLFRTQSPDLKIISQTKAIYTFRNIQLPRDGRKDVEFSAYAFNTDRVKSDTARTKFTLPATGVKTARTAYIVSVGVNTNNLGLNLDYAAADARAIREELAKRLSPQFGVVTVELISEKAKDKAPELKNATRANIRTVLKMLSGVSVPAKDRGDLEKSIGDETASRITRSTPDDLIIISLSSHGYADISGIFYMLPSDISKKDVKQELPDLSSMISSDELSLWMRDMDSLDILMIVDACHAGSLTGSGFKPGPMGSRGLGQLAYDKRARIIAATQAADTAQETSGDCNLGLLTCALIKKGLQDKDSPANFKPKDDKILIGEWLEFGKMQVPVLFEAAEKRNGKKIPGDHGVETVLQRPEIFDFVRDRKTDISLGN